MTQFSRDEANALSRNGWTINNGRSKATRDYKGAVKSLITVEGGFVVSVGGAVRLSGNERGPILAAMEANNQAWAQPEYTNAGRS